MFSDGHKIRNVRKNVLATTGREIYPVDGNIKVHSAWRKKMGEIFNLSQSLRPFLGRTIKIHGGFFGRLSWKIL